MKSHQRKNEKERRAKVEFRQFIRKIPDNEMLTKILMEIPDKPFRRDFFYRALRYLKFVPNPLEALDKP